MMFAFFSLLLIVFSVLSTLVSLIFMLLPDLYAKMDEFLGYQIGGRTILNSVLEGRIDIIDRLVMRHRFMVGSLLCILSVINTRNAFILGGF